MQEKSSSLLREMKKKRKKKKILLIFKAALAFYLLVFSIRFFTSETTAYYISNDKAKFVFKAWEDNSLLQFADNGNDSLSACPANMEATLKNVSDSDMQTSGTYEIYYKKDKQREKIELADSEGIIPVLKAGEEVKLTYSTNKEGTYEFIAHQNKVAQDVSIEVNVTCNVENEEKQNNEGSSEEIKPTENQNETEEDEQDQGESTNNDEKQEVNNTETPDVPVEDSNKDKAENGQDGNEETGKE